MVTITFTQKYIETKKRQIEDFIVANIDNDEIIENEQIYKNNLQYFLINELLKNNKYELATKVMEDIKKEVLTNIIKTRQIRRFKNLHIEIDDNFYLHLALVYEKTNITAALDSVKNIKENDLKEFCLFILENKNFNFLDKKLFACKTENRRNKENLSLNTEVEFIETDSLTQKYMNNQISLLKEEVFNKKYNKYFIDFFIKQFSDSKELIKFLDENLNEKWLEELTLQNKIDFYMKTKQINLCLYFLETGFIKKPDPLSFEYKNEKIKEKIKNFLNEKLKEKIEKKAKIEQRKTKYKFLIFPGKICTKVSGQKIDLSKNEDILLMTEIKKEKSKKLLNKILKTKQLKTDYKIKEE